MSDSQGAFREQVWQKTGGHCWYCGEEVGWAKYSECAPMHVEHQLPRSRGGTDRFDNLVPACIPCNQRKGVFTLKEYRLFMTLLVANRVGRAPIFKRYQIGWLSQHDFEMQNYHPYVFWGEYDDAAEEGV